MRTELPKGLRFMELTVEKEEELWRKMSSINGMFDDFQKDSRAIFRHNLYAPNSMWLETTDGIGVLYLLNIMPGLSASAHFVFFDGKLRGREELCKDALRFAMQNIPLSKVNVWLPTYVHWLRRFVKRLGFTTEGKIRRWSIHDGKFFDVVAHGITYEEVMSDGDVYRPGGGSSGQSNRTDESTRDDAGKSAENVAEQVPDTDSRSTAGQQEEHRAGVLRPSNGAKAASGERVRTARDELLPEDEAADDGSTGSTDDTAGSDKHEQPAVTVRTRDGAVPVRNDDGRR